MVGTTPAVGRADARLARIDLDDTRRCPTAKTCAGCGTPSGPGRLAVATAEIMLGVFCLTLCSTCARSARLPRYTLAEANKAVLTHCRHLGIDADTAAARYEMRGRA